MSRRDEKAKKRLGQDAVSQEERDKTHISIAVSIDMRETSPRLSQALIDGIIDFGGNVLDLGLCTTPMNYFAAATLDVDGSVMTTASHNPKEYNGFKFCRKGGVSMNYEDGIHLIEEFCNKKMIERLNKPESQGTITAHDIKPAYMKRMCELAEIDESIKIVADAGNGMAGLSLPLFVENFPEITMVPLFFDLDGTFPNHEANPSKHETLEALQRAVIAEGAQFGVAFDGDADRAVFVDEQGEIVPADLLTGVIATYLLEETKEKAAILYDLRTSRAVSEMIEEAGGIPVMCRVGHSYIQELMAKHDALFGGELSGHYYFKDFYNCDNALLTLITMLRMTTRSEEPLSRMIEPFKKYAPSGEINFEVKDTDAVLLALRETYAEHFDTDMDGVRFVADDFWFVVRPSNTEPVVRLTLEAVSKKVMEEKVEEIRKIIEQH
jgi:phosphomannomutase